MCGLAGILAPTGEPTRLAAALDLMDRALVHRGPDGAGRLVAADLLLAHRRLAVIDPTPAANQPFTDPSGRVTIVFNGEIYNYRALREECAQAGLPLVTASDTEAIVGQYLLHGDRAFARLEGIFALALHDRAHRVSFLARDPFGIKPLHWAARPDGVLFASELGALLSSGLLPADVDPAGLEAYLRLDAVPAPLSIVAGAQQLPAGFFLRVAPGGAPRVRRFAPQPPPPSTRHAAESEDVTELDRLLGAAVRRQLVADVPVGVFLSGGLDSSLVAAAAAEATGGRIEAFAVGFDDPSFDESRWAESAARHLGLRLTAARLDPEEMRGLLPRLPELSGGEPIADGSLFPTFLLSRFVRRSATVALSGDGGDELFGGYPTHAVAGFGALASRLPAALRRAIARGADRLLPVSESNLSFDFRVRKFLDGLDPDPILRNARWLGTFLPEELPDLLAPGRVAPGLDGLLHEPSTEAGPTASPLERILRTDQRFYLGQVLAKVDRASMASALEVRVPMLDGDLVRFARALPPERKISGGDSKRLLRLLASRKGFDPLLVHRPKKGFGAPLARWFRVELRDLVADILSPAAVARAGLVRPGPVNAMLAEHRAGRRDHRKRIFSLLALHLWHDDARRRSGAASPHA